MFILTQMKTIVTMTAMTEFFMKSIKFLKDDENFAKFTSYWDRVTRASGLSYWTHLIIKGAHAQRSSRFSMCYETQMDSRCPKEEVRITSCWQGTCLLPRVP